MKSLSEIETTVKRASKAAGYSWGVSEETGKSIRLLELFSCLLYTSPSPRDYAASRMPSSA